MPSRSVRRATPTAFVAARALLLALALPFALAAAPAAAQDRPRNPFEALARAGRDRVLRAKADALLLKAFTLDVTVRRSASGLRRAIPSLLEAASLYGQIGDRPGQLRSLAIAAGAYRELDRADSAMAIYRRMLPVAAGPGGDPVAVRSVYHYTGDIYRSLGRADSALVYYRKGEGFRRDWLDIHVNGSDLESSGDDGPPTDPPPTGQSATLSSIAQLFQETHRSDSALHYYRLATAAAGREPGARGTVSGKDVGTFALMDAWNANGIGAAYLDLGMPDSALVHFRRSAALARTEWAAWSGRKTRVDALHGTGRAHAMLGRPDSALAYFAQSLALSRKLGDRSGEARSLYAVGRLAHRPSRPDEADLARAAAYYDSAAAVLASLADVAGSDANRTSLAELGAEITEEWALALLAREGTAGGGAGAAARAALGAAERGRAQALLDLMRDSVARIAPGADLAAEGERLARAATPTGTPALSYLVTRDTLVVWLAAPGGNVVAVRQAAGRDSVAALVDALRAGLSVDDAAAGERLAVRGGALEGADDATRGGTARRAPRRGMLGAEDAAGALSALLLPREVAQALGARREVVVVPHGPLALVPFAVLPGGGAHAFRYAPSLASLGEVEAVRARRAAAAGADTTRARLRGALVVGNPQMPAPSGGATPLAPLPAAGEEAAAVAALLGGESLTGGAASESEVRRRLPRAPLVHLATHGYAYASDARARASFVALAPDGSHDGLLTVGELLDDRSLALAAELVVLSACQTGLGDLKRAEGTIGLQRAFLARGASGVLVSLWSVSDEATGELMRRFYGHWLDDADRPSKAEALRRAQDDVRTMPGFDHPRFWAAFQVVGAR